MALPSPIVDDLPSLFISQAQAQPVFELGKEGERLEKHQHSRGRHMQNTTFYREASPHAHFHLPRSVPLGRVKVSEEEVSPGAPIQSCLPRPTRTQS